MGEGIYMRVTRNMLAATLLGVAVLTACSFAGRVPEAAARPGAAPSRADVAQAMFAERCKAAGEKIYKTVENVEGVYLLKLRPQSVNFGDQYAMDDPYGSDLGGDGYIQTFLREFYMVPAQSIDALPQGAYRYVEAVDPTDGKRYRYTGRLEEPWVANKHYAKGYIRLAVDKVPAPSGAPQYGVTYEDISTREDRDHWIAGSSLKVVDILTGDVLAERIGYMYDPAQGSRAGGRAPWLLAASYACPAFPGRHASRGQFEQTKRFVEKTLKPRSWKY
jgi:hypothetical protein